MTITHSRGSESYGEGWERIFGDKKEPQAATGRKAAKKKTAKKKAAKKSTAKVKTSPIKKVTQRKAKSGTKKSPGRAKK